LLLALLQDNDRLALAHLSKATGVAASTPNDRIKRFARQGVVAGGPTPEQETWMLNVQVRRPPSPV